MNIIVAGDYSPQYRLEPIIKARQYDLIFNNIKDIILSADFSVVNFETTLGDISKDSKVIKNGSHLYSPEEALESLRWAGFNTLTLANNHILDYSGTALERTISYAYQYGFNIVGAGRNLNEAAAILTLVQDNIRVAIINCCEHEYSIASEETPGANPLNPINQFYHIKEARKNHDYVIVITHGGHEHFQLPSLRMQDTYRFFIDAGADAVINHHQHCYSGYEIYNEKPIFYGLGNFCFDEKIHVRPDLWHKAYMVKFNFIKNSMGFNIIPIIQCEDKPNVTLRDKAEFDIEINALNNIISDREKLKNAINEYYCSSKREMLLKFQPYNNRILRSAYSRGLIPSALSHKKILSIHNAIACESHNDKLMYTFNQLIDEYKNN